MDEIRSRFWRRSFTHTTINALGEVTAPIDWLAPPSVREWMIGYKQGTLTTR